MRANIFFSERKHASDTTHELQYPENNLSKLRRALRYTTTEEKKKAEGTKKKKLIELFFSFCRGDTFHVDCVVNAGLRSQ